MDDHEEVPVPQDPQVQLAVRDTTPAGLSIDTMTRYAKAFVLSGLFKTQDTNRGLATAFVKIQAGQELGLPPFAAMRGLNVMDGGKVELSAGLMASLVKRSGVYRYRVTESTGERCVLTWFERVPGHLPMDPGAWEEVGTSSFTVADAVQAGLCKVDANGKVTARSDQGKALPWEKFTEDMLFNRALSRGFRRHCPDLAAGAPVYVEGEVSGVPQEDPGTEPQPEPITVSDAAGDVVEVNPDTGEVVQPTLDESPPDRPIETHELPDPVPPAEPKPPATAVQLGRIATLCEQAGVAQEAVAARFGWTDIGQLDSDDAARAIRALEETLRQKAGV